MLQLTPHIFVLVCVLSFKSDIIIIKISSSRTGDIQRIKFMIHFDLGIDDLPLWAMTQLRNLLMETFSLSFH